MISPRRWLVAWVALFCLASGIHPDSVMAKAKAKSAKTSKPAPAPAASLEPLPASFSGTLPCADCAGIEYLINLLQDGAYMQRTTYLRDGRDETSYEIGAWSLSNDHHTLVLNRGESSTYWSIQSATTLRKLDREGGEIVSRLPYELTRSATLRTMEPRLRLRGFYQNMTHEARFSDCLSGLQWPVSQQGAYRDLERAYAAQKKKTKASSDLLVSLDARITAVPAEAGGGEPTLVVERFLGASPSQICAEAPIALELPHNRWRPTVVGGRAVVVSSHQHEPWIVLDPKSSRVTGSGGCNRLSGSYHAYGDGRLEFSQLAAPEMPCSSLETERAFFKALMGTKSYRIVGRNLELFGKDGSMVARLEERNL